MDTNNGANAQTFFATLNNLTLKEAGRIATIVARAGEGWFELDSVASALEENKKSFLAKLVLEYMDNGLPGAKEGTTRAMPVNQAETRATGDPRFQEYVKNMVDARRRANLERVKYDMGRVFIEMQRSNAANERSEMHMTRTQ
jgi:hypothetical protein